MSVSKDNVVAALGKIASPDGAPLPATGKLSDIVVADDKVFFSITVDAGAVRDWEAVSERAQDAVRALPGVQSVMVALTAERAGGGTGAHGAPSRPQGAPPRPGGPAGPAPAGIPGVAAISVRSSSDELRSLQIVPLPLTGPGARFAPLPDEARRDPVDTHWFTGNLWLMTTGTWQVRLQLRRRRR